MRPDELTNCPEERRVGDRRMSDDIELSLAGKIGKLEGEMQSVLRSVGDMQRDMRCLSEAVQRLIAQIEPLFDNGQPGVLSRLASDGGRLKEAVMETNRRMDAYVNMGKGAQWAGKFFYGMVGGALSTAIWLGFEVFKALHK